MANTLISSPDTAPLLSRRHLAAPKVTMDYARRKWEDGLFLPGYQNPSKMSRSPCKSLHPDACRRRVHTARRPAFPPPLEVQGSEQDSTVARERESCSCFCGERRLWRFRIRRCTAGYSRGRIAAGLLCAAAWVMR